MTTPDTASAPYTDEAPPVTISTRCSAADGITGRIHEHAAVHRHEPLAIHQHEIAIGTEATQAHVRRADGIAGGELDVARVVLGGGGARAAAAD